MNSERMATGGKRQTFKDFYGEEESVESAPSKSKTSEGTSPSAKCESHEKASASCKSKASYETDFSRKCKVSEEGKTPSKVSECTGTFSKSNDHESGTSGKSKDQKNGAAGRSKDQKTSASGRSKDQKTGASGRSKTSQNAGGSSGNKTSHGVFGIDDFTIPAGGTSTRLGEIKSHFMRHTIDSIAGPIKEGDSEPSEHTLLQSTEWFGGPPPRIYRREKSVAERLPAQFCTDGAKVKRTESDAMSRPSHVCNSCSKTSVESLKRCSRCLAVSYCNRLCQRQDFKTHKSFCQRSDRYDIARARVYPAVRFFQDMRHARDYSVLLRDMPTEEQYHQGAWCNILVEMLGRIPHFKRYICLVRDLSGLVTKVVFHDESNLYTHPSFDSARQSRPLDLGAFLVAGDFLLLVGAHWRQFQDGTVGIRVNDLASIYVINMADHVIGKDYGNEVEQGVAGYDNSPKKPMFHSLLLDLMKAEFA